jgi:hypothetical protein
VNLKGGEKMKSRLITTAMLALFLGSMLIASVAACSAKPLKSRPLRCELSLELDMSLPGWRGTVTGDIEGSYTWTLKESTWKDTTEYYSGTWVIETAYGSISGFDAGMFSLETYKWVEFGRVTAATGKWHYLIGSLMWNSGTTPSPVTGVGTLTIVPCYHW